jgi:ligand-binding sensor domain-containing protein
VNVAALAVAGDRLYVGGFDQGLFVVEPDHAPRRLQAPGLSQHINALAWSAAERVLWVATARGLVRCRHEAALTCLRIGPTRAVHALLLRQGGELVAGGDDGLLFVRGETTRVLGKKERAPFRAVWALAEAGGHLYVGAINGLFWGATDGFHPEAPLSRASVVQGSLPDDWVTALLVQENALYVGTYNSGVAHFVRGAGKLVRGGNNPALGHVNPAGIVPLSADTLAVCSMEGLWNFSPTGKVHRLERLGDITAVARAPSGDYWVSTRQGLERLEPSQAKERDGVRDCESHVMRHTHC